MIVSAVQFWSKALRLLVDFASDSCMDSKDKSAAALRDGFNDVLEKIFGR